MTLDIDDAHAVAYEARGERFVSHRLGEQLLTYLEQAIGEVRHSRAVTAQADSGRAEDLTMADLRVQLDVMTAREKRWREHAMATGSQRARDSVSAFSDFCEGHKAGMSQR